MDTSGKKQDSLSALRERYVKPSLAPARPRGAKATLEIDFREFREGDHSPFLVPGQYLVHADDLVLVRDGGYLGAKLSAPAGSSADLYLWFIPQDNRVMQLQVLAGEGGSFEMLDGNEQPVGHHGLAPSRTWQKVSLVPTGGSIRGFRLLSRGAIIADIVLSSSAQPQT